MPIVSRGFTPPSLVDHSLLSCTLPTCRRLKRILHHRIDYKFKAIAEDYACTEFVECRKGGFGELFSFKAAPKAMGELFKATRRPWPVLEVSGDPQQNPCNFCKPQAPETTPRFNTHTMNSMQCSGPPGNQLGPLTSAAAT